MGSHQNEKSVPIIRVSAFQGEVFISRTGQKIAGTLKSVRIIKLSPFQGCLQGGPHCNGRAHTLTTIPHSGV